MIKSIFYITSLIFLIYNFLMFKKSEKKLNIILWLILSLVLIFSLNSIVSYIYNLVYIPITLITLTIFNTLLSIYLFYKNKKEKQSYYFHKKDLIFIIILMIGVGFIGYLRFGCPLNITYDTSDPGVHFWTSLDFYKSSTLLNHSRGAIDFATRQFASYTNVGLLFKILSFTFNEISFYKLYIFYDLFSLFMSGICFYFLTSKLFKNINSIFLMLISIIYILGYPLNNMLFGFFYSGHALIIIEAIILLFSKKGILNNKIFKILLFILNTGLMCTYYFYVPVIYLGEIIYLIYLNKKFDKSLIYLILLPCILGLIYFIIPNIGNDMNAISQLKLDGLSYNNFISNFIVFIPILIYSFFIKKEKDYTFFTIISFILFIITMGLLASMGVATYYYLSKTYYLGWLFAFILVCIVWNNINNKYLKKGYIITLIIVFILPIFNISVFDVYKYNFDKINTSRIILTSDEIKVVEEAYNHNASDVVINLSPYNYQKVWIDAWFWKSKIDYPENQIYTYIVGQKTIYDMIDNNDKESYYIFFKRDGNNIDISSCNNCKVIKYHAGEFVYRK